MIARRKSWIRLGIIILAAALMAGVCNGYAVASYGILHTFTGSDGDSPRGCPVISESTIYGMTTEGGEYNKGAVFRVNTDGTGFQLLHSFSITDGAAPCDTLTLSGTTLYGMTCQSSNSGTIFKIGTDGNGFEVLHDFLGGSLDGATPFGSLTLSGSILYGMTNEGGSWNLGTVFQFNTNTSEFRVLYSFSGASGDGSSPFGSLTLSGTSLCGMTQNGGAADKGIVFRINTDGTEFEILHSFSDDNIDGILPLSTLTLLDSTLYGVTPWGGKNGSGTIFRIDTGGSGYEVLHSFAYGPNFWILPKGPLAATGSALYGMTEMGGKNDSGTIFRIITDGTGFQTLHNFPASTNDGISPRGSVTVSGSNLYGFASKGSAETSKGVVFSMGSQTSSDALSVPILELLLLQQ
ncbi:MAG: choice-of-anchor tandem repeat GloVer-containing protein [Syntrophobacteraceae bacterium]